MKTWHYLHSVPVQPEENIEYLINCMDPYFVKYYKMVIVKWFNLIIYQYMEQQYIARKIYDIPGLQ